jgi:hypothetical protein
MPNVQKKLEKVKDPYDPNRCQGMIRNNQCPFVKEPGEEFCQVHINKAAVIEEVHLNKSLRNYHLAKWQSRVNEFADHSEVKSLREEIGISRMILENILDRCHDSHDLFLYANKISDHVSKIERIVVSCHRLEQSTGSLLDKTMVLQIANTIIEILSRHIDSVDILEKVSEEIINMVLKTSKLEPEVSTT